MAEELDYHGRMYATQGGLRLGQVIGVLLLVSALSSLTHPLSQLVYEFLRRGANDALPAVPDNSATTASAATASAATALAIAFGMAAFGALIFWCASRELIRRENVLSLQGQHPGEPWRWRDDWGDRRIRSSGRMKSLVVSVVASIYLLLVLPVGLTGIYVGNKSLATMPAIVMLLLAWPIYNWGRQYLRRYLRYDRAQFHLGADTGVIGGPLSGTVVFPNPLPSDIVLRVTLESLETQGYDRKRKTPSQDTLLWRDTMQLENTWAFEQSHAYSVPIYFAIPFDCQPTTLGRRSVRWLLKVGPDGGELMREFGEFEVPVFRTPKSSSKFKPDRSSVERFEPVSEINDILLRAGVLAVGHPDGTIRIDVSLFRPIILVGGLLGLVIFAAAAVGLAWSGAWWVAIVPVVATLLIVVGLHELLCWRSQMEINNQVVRVCSGTPVWRIRWEQELAAIGKFQADTEFRTQEMIWYCVRLVRSDGQRLLVAKRLPTRRDAEQLAQWFTEQVNVASKGAK